jgi:hypothetical protein
LIRTPHDDIIFDVSNCAIESHPERKTFNAKVPKSGDEFVIQCMSQESFAVIQERVDFVIQNSKSPLKEELQLQVHSQWWKQYKC